MYCTRDALILRFGEDIIADLEYNRPNALAEAITDSDALIDGYMGGRYPVPLNPVPHLIRRVAFDVVRYSLDVDPDEHVVRRRNEAIKLLVSLSRGEVSLGLPVIDEPDGFDAAQIENDGHVFRRPNSQTFN